MNILVIGHEYQDFTNATEPWGFFFDTIKLHGHNLVARNFKGEIHALIAHSHSLDIIKLANQRNIPIANRFLVFWEPYIVDRERYKFETASHYGYLFFPSKFWNIHNLNNARFFNWPQDEIGEIEDFDSWKRRKNKFTLIQGNKFSATKGELYTLRRNLISQSNSDLEFYGRNWNEGFLLDLARWLNSVRKSKISEFSYKSSQGIGRFYDNYRGDTENKLMTHKSYRHSIVIENMDNYISEKLFDSVAGGCNTIYVGPDLSQFGVEKSGIIQIEPEIDKLKSTILDVIALTETEQYELASSQNSRFQSLNQFWNNKVVFSNLAEEICRLMYTENYI